MGMLGKRKKRTAIYGGVAALFIAANRSLGAADDTPVTRGQFLQLQKQNELLLQQLQAQQKTIDALAHKVADIENHDVQHPAEMPTSKAPAKAEVLAPPAGSDTSFNIGKVNITGEGGVAFFDSQKRGQMPHPTFRIDEAKIFLEAPVWDDVYFYTELDLASRESTSLGLNVGELYLDFEDVSKLWGRERMLNIRAGQFYIPFGEEYLNRFAIDNPLISHSVSDLWGSDAGVELYGKLGEWRYVVAVQDGGGATSQALQDDKSVAGRVSYDPAKWLHVSASGMRTGNLSVNNGVSAMWFGNGFFRSLDPAHTTTFHANLVEGDVQVNLPCVQAKAAGGYINYGDNDPTANNHRDVYYYYVEGLHNFDRNLYAAARFSQIFAPNGFPIVGNGPMGTYLFGDLTKEYWRLSLGLGYRFSPNLLVKGEYSFNQGQEANGADRSGENLVSLEAAFKF
jgi:hypothetical protein